ncbi:MAG: type II toxin-antitoxin system RelE/ParE family toxin [Alphaproteobacteria bacterium]|nr:type II toxin-antitoxin system RelE/ParE family toxin [Alphaproteobacteria bacterium]
MNIGWSAEALADLAVLHAYIANDNPVAADRIAAEIVRAVRVLLPDHPHIGKPGRVSGTRELVIPRTDYIVPYRIQGDVVQVLRVYHAARRWPDSL